MFKSLVTRMTHQTITWEQLSAFSHLHMVKTTWWSSTWSSGWGRKGAEVTLKVVNIVVGGRWDVSVLQTAADLLGFSPHHNVSRVHREQSQKEKISSEPLLYSMGIDDLLKSGVGGQNALTGWRPQKGNTISHNQWSQPGSTLRNVWTPTTLKQKSYKYLVYQHTPGTLRGT